MGRRGEENSSTDWAEHFLDLKKKRTKAVREKITQDLKELCKDLSEFSPKSTSQVKTKIKNLPMHMRTRKRKIHKREMRGKSVPILR